MVACKILLVCLAVLAINARESSQTQLLENSLNSDCPCFPTDKGGERISKLADKYGKHERTVIYLYRHQDSGDITVYVPNEEKQTKFPDLTVSNLEFYGFHPLENIYQLFNKPSNFVTTSPVVDQPHSIDTQYIHDPDISNPHIVNKVINGHHPNIVDINSNIVNEKNTPSDVIPPYHNTIKPSDTKVDSDGNKKKETDFTKVPLELQTHISQPIHVVVPGHNTVGPNYENPSTKNVVDNTNLPNKYDIHNGHLHNPEDDILVEWEQNKKVPDLYDETANHVELGGVDNYITKIQELLNGNKNKAIPSSINLKPLNNPVFEKWLFDEISNVGTSGSGTLSYDTVDLQQIKTHLLILLTQNGLHFSESGNLYDNNGRSLKLSNLKLRRVMISDPVLYNKAGGRNCVPQGIPYLEAVFVSLAYPPTVLGVIPLKVTSLPSCKGGKCHGKVCTSRNYQHFVVNSKFHKKINLAPTHNTKLEKLFPRHSSGNRNQFLLHIPKHDIGVNDGLVHHDLDKTLSGHDNDDGLGIRIIGGGPAVSSGTPVSSRGRSGYKSVKMSAY